MHVEVGDVNHLLQALLAPHSVLTLSQLASDTSLLRNFIGIVVSLNDVLLHAAVVPGKLPSRENDISILM